MIVSCAHYEGTFEDESSDSEWSCTDSTESKVFERKKDEEVNLKVNLEESSNAKEEAGDEESDFHFYFFPECNKPIPPDDDKASLIIVDGFPKINKIEAVPDCTCEVDKTGKCPCHLKVPCECGPKKRDECICHEAENICICGDTPELICKCKPNKVCMCHPDGKPRPICACGKGDKPCICQPGKFPYPICVCEHKPNIEVKNENEVGEEMSSILEKKESIKEPCLCQKPSPKPTCLCIKGKDCICKQGTCICGVQPTICLCDPAEGEINCDDNDSKTICSCPVDPECKCYGNSPDDCSCFPKVKYCTCGNPEDCTCLLTCECKDPCLCDIVTVKKENICVCEDKLDSDSSDFHDKKEDKKLKRVRAGKHGYRWCHDVDPKHTYFDFAYNRHDKISYKEQVQEKLKILGLYEESKKADINIPGIESDKVPVFKKKVRKPSIDCCSAVGGTVSKSEKLTISSKFYSTPCVHWI